ncbi:MAG: HAMP domain-containing methyl-accepting chemotaxis protein [Clostridiales bacterium]
MKSLIKFNFFNSINKKINISIISCFIILITISVVVTIQFRLNEGEKTINEKGTTLINLSMLSLSESMWNYNQESIKVFSNAIIRDKEVSSIKVFDSNEKIIYTAINKNKKLKNTEKLTFVSYIERDKDRLGKVEIELTKYYLDLGLNNTIIYSIIQNIIISVIFSIIIFFISKRITKPLFEVIKMANKVSNGDYKSTVDVKSNDEIGILVNTFNSMAKNVLKTMVELKNTGDKLKNYIENLENMNSSITNVSSELNNSSTDLAASTQELNANIEEVSSHTNIISNVVINVFEKTEKLTKESDRISTLSLNSKKVIDNTLSKINNIKDIFNDIKNKVLLLKKSSSKIMKVTGIIDRISSQINLISLNASIESAKAGEAGKGFSVVANEIRKLSLETSKATKDIKNQVTSINNDINITFKSTEKGNIEIIEGVNLTNQTAAAIDNITNSIIENINEVKEIESESKKAADGVKSVVRNMKEFTDTIEQLVLFSSNLAKMVEQLYSMIKENSR